MKRKTQKTISVFITLLLVLLLPVQAFAGEYNIANGDITVTVNGSGEQHISYFDEYNAKQEVDNDDNPVITGFSTDNIVTITVAAGQTANVTLKDLQIAHSSSTNEAAVSTSGDGDVNIELDGDNWLMSGNRLFMIIGKHHLVNIVHTGSLLFSLAWSDVAFFIKELGYLSC